LRHDDPRLDDIKTSFELVLQPEEQLTWTPNGSQEAKAKPEALVKGITPSQPAPIHTPGPAAATKQAAVTTRAPGMFQRFMNWITGASAPVEEAPAAPPPKAPSGRNRGQRPGERRERGQHDRERQRGRRGE